MSPFRKKRRITREWLYLRLFEYMFYSEPKQGFTKYELMRINDLPAQRQDRISEIIDKMVEMEHLQIVFETSNATYYNISPDGKEWYLNTGKSIQNFFKKLRE